MVETTGKRPRSHSREERQVARILFGVMLVVLFGVSIFQSVPGYMDAEYYFSGGRQLYLGEGFSEPFIWNFLSDPDRLPAPSHAYWMPLASVLTFLGMKLFGSGSFWAGRLVFILLAAWVPTLTLRLSGRFRSGQAQMWSSGLLAVFSGYYLVYYPITDTFGLYMVLGAVFLLVAGIKKSELRVANIDTWPLLQPFILGSLAAWMHLARADGLIWLAVAWIWSGISCRKSETERPVSLAEISWGRAARNAGLVLGGYLFWMLPWFLRNLSTFGTPLAPGGFQTLWLTDYDELYAYPASQLTFTRWWTSGIGAILDIRLDALVANVQTAVAVQGLVFLAPFILAGLWKMRRQIEVQLGVMAWGLTFLAMTIVFPFAGSRGGFFHSGAAVQTLFWAVAPVGIDAFIDWGRRKRGWHPAAAGKVYRTGFLIIGLLLTGFITLSKLGASSNAQAGSWGAGATHYQIIEQGLIDRMEFLGGQGLNEPVMVNNPPGYWLATGRQAVSIPYGNADTILAVAQRYQIHYLILEIDQVQGAAWLSENPSDRPGFDHLATVDDAQIYQLYPGH